MRLAALQDYTKAAGEEMAEQRGRFDRLANKESAPRVVSSFNLFQTPEPLAARVAAMLERSGRILEPSAGLGRLYRAARALSDSQIVLVENSADCCQELYRSIENDRNAKLVQEDFLACDAERLGGLFDGVLMNPPFKMGTDIKHILHARSLLAPGGRLVAICADGPKQQKALQPIATDWVKLPANSFKEAGTSVSTSLFVFDAD